MSYTQQSSSYLLDSHDNSAPPGEEESLLSRTFQRGFAAGEALSSQEFTKLLPALLDEFTTRHAEDADAVRWATAFANFARQRLARRGVEMAYLAEGAGI